MPAEKSGRRGEPVKRGKYNTYSQNPNKKLTEAQEAFARFKATPDEKGDLRSDAECYRLAYPNAGKSTVEDLSWRLGSMPAVVKRVEELREKRNAKFEITADWITEQYRKRYSVNVADYWKTIEVDSEGTEYPLGQAPEGVKTRIYERHKRLDELSLDQQLLLDGFTVEKTTKGSIKTEFKLDKKSALDQLAKGAGYFVEKVDVTSGGKPIESLSAEERTAEVIAILNAAGEREA